MNVTYRLRVFGYLLNPGIAPAKLSLHDQIEGLRCVQRNSKASGGDPRRVSLFGQYTSGYLIACFLASEETKGLFHWAAVQSTPSGTVFHGNRIEAVLATRDYAR